MMKNYCLCILMTVAFNSAFSQIAQLTITPANPTPADTIYVISTLTYSGNCTYGLVYTYTAVTGNTVQIMPTYCGHGASTTCVSTDTFKIPPLGIGNYIIKIDYHQGSVCPISNFDAVIGHTNSAVSVSTMVTTHIQTSSQGADLKIYPNPVREQLAIDLPGMPAGTSDLIIIRNILGETLICKKVDTQSLILDVAWLPPGIYTVELERSNSFVSKQRLVVQ